MAELLECVASWRALLVVLLVFGFLPGALLRLICLCFPKDDPRRAELRGELNAVPRPRRPLWVAEQFEVALFEGIPARARQLARRIQTKRCAKARFGRFQEFPGYAAFEGSAAVESVYTLAHRDRRRRIEITRQDDHELIRQVHDDGETAEHRVSHEEADIIRRIEATKRERRHKFGAGPTT